MDLHTLGEFGLIDLIDIPCPNPATVHVGIGDDCAVLPYDDRYYQLASCDLLVEGVHFIRDKIAPYQIGYKAVAVNLSDIAAMGGKPTHILLSAALPPNYTIEEWQELYRGIGDICNRYDVNLIGGDTTASPDKLAINVTVLGLVEQRRLHLRRNAKPGDAIFVTNVLGGSRAGLELILQDEITIPDDIRTELLRYHCQPEPCYNEIAVLNQIADTQLHALNDISDGLISESYEIADASDCALVLYADKIPVCPEAAYLAKQIGADSLQWALSGGEDYQLVGTLDGDFAETICETYHAQTGKTITLIGYVTEGSGVYLQDANQMHLIPKKGYDHFQNAQQEKEEKPADDPVVQLLLNRITELNRQIEAQSVYRHDFKNHLSCVQGLLELGDSEQALQYLYRLLEAAPQSQIKHYHNRAVLNILCNQKALLANARDIEFQFNSVTERDLLSFVSDYDLCTMIGNMLDNGIEHADGEELYLYLDLFLDEAGNTVLRMENSCHTPPTLHHGIFISCKKDASSHGKGMEQIRHIVEKYHGTFSWRFDPVEERFIMQCVFEKR